MSVDGDPEELPTASRKRGNSGLLSPSKRVRMCAVQLSTEHVSRGCSLLCADVPPPPGPTPPKPHPITLHRPIPPCSAGTALHYLPHLPAHSHAIPHPILLCGPSNVVNMTWAPSVIHST